MAVETFDGQSPSDPSVGSSLRGHVHEGDGGGRFRRRVAVGERRQGGLVSDVRARLLAQEPADLEEVAIGLGRVADPLDGFVRLGDLGPEDVVQPALRGDISGHVVAVLPPQPADVGAEVVHQDGGLAFAHLQAGQPTQLVGVERPARDAERQPDPLGARLLGLEPHLVHGEAELVETAYPRLDVELLVQPDHRLLVQHLPQRVVAAPHALGLVHHLLDRLVGRLQPRGDVEQAAEEVLRHDVEVEVALAGAQGLVPLGRLGVDQPGPDELAVAHEEGVGERAVPPVEAVAMEVDEEGGDGVEQPRPVGPHGDGHPHQQAAVLPRGREVVRDEHGGVLEGLHDHTRSTDG